MIAIINYDAGNLASVSNALKRLDVQHIITNNPNELDQAEGVIFPGVGHAQPAMQSLRKNKLDAWLKSTDKTVLGICLGMQLLFETSQEGDDGTAGLGILAGTLKKFNSGQKKVPHMGWNTLSKVRKHPLLNGITKGEYFYYVHSYFAPVTDYTVAQCNYGRAFSSIVAKDNFMGVQFHPEKSGEAGARLLLNFIKIVSDK